MKYRALAASLLFGFLMSPLTASDGGELIQLRVGAKKDSQLGRLIRDFENGVYKIQPDALRRFVAESSIPPQGPRKALESFKSTADRTYLHLSMKRGSEAGRFAQAVQDGVFKVIPDAVHRLITAGYVPAAGEPSVVDLFNTYYIRGDIYGFNREIKPLSDRGNPVAWALYGWSLVNANFPAIDPDWQQGLALMKKAAAAGVSSAYNDEAILFWIILPGQKTGYIDAYNYIPKNMDNDPRDWTNSALVRKDTGSSDFWLGFQNAAEDGDPSGAGELAQFYTSAADPEPESALKWFLCSYHGSTSMDWFAGLEPMIESIKMANYSAATVQKVQEDSANWLKTHPKIFNDGFDLLRMAIQGPASVQKVDQLPESSTVQDLFWKSYAIGDKAGFAKALEPFVEKGDANALYMKAHLATGFVGDPDPTSRRTYLQQAVAKNHPLAFKDLALDLWLEGNLSSGKYQQQCFKRAADLLTEGYQTWFGKHPEAIGELVFFLGYFTQFGIGFPKPNPQGCKQYYIQAFYLTPLVMGHLGRQSTDNAIQRCVYLTIARPSLTQGDWFGGGILDWFNSVQALDQEQLTKAKTLVKAFQARDKRLGWNFYQRMAAGLDEDFSGIRN